MASRRVVWKFGKPLPFLLFVREKFLSEIRNLERAKDYMTVEQAFMMDKFRQMKAENDRLKDEMSAFRTRLGNATEDYVSTTEDYIMLCHVM